jgi:hypothetical protein
MKNSDDETLVREAAAELEQYDAPIEVVLRPLSALQLSGLLQLALRHPGAKGESRRTALIFIEHVRRYFAEAPAPAIVEMIRRGDDPDYDVPTVRTP